MKQIMGEWPNRKALSSGIAHCYYAGKMLLQRLRQFFGVLAGDIHADFFHYINGQGGFIRGLHRRAYADELVTRECVQKTFGHLTARRIASRKEKHLGFVIHYAPSVSHHRLMRPATDTTQSVP